jgi:predicted amidohydrolase
LTTSKSLVALRFDSKRDYEQNLSVLISLVDEAKDNSIIVAPEVCLSDYDYDNFQKAIEFTPYAIEKLLLHVKSKTLILTVIERREDGVYNVAKVLHRGEVIYSQPKAKLFKFGDEHHYFKAGDESDIAVFEVDGIKMGILICFELRFKKFWSALEGADIIAIPARWGKIRTQNFISLTNALAIINQCYVIASDASNDDFTGESGIITPFGQERRNANLKSITEPFDASEIKKMRRYMDVGIK